MSYALPTNHRVRTDAVGAYLELFLRDPGDEPMDLSDAVSVTITIVDERGNVVQSEQPLTILSATQGHILYVYQSTELASARRLLGVLRVRRGSSGGGEWGWVGGWQGGWDGLSGGAAVLNLASVPSAGAIIIDVL